MKRVERRDDWVYAASIAWNVPELRASDRQDVRDFISVIRLAPTAFTDPGSIRASARMSPILRAAEGLKAELLGDASVAQEHYMRLSRHPGLPGLLGLLLIAWMRDAEEVHFDRAEHRLRILSGATSSDTIARAYCKLATWSSDRGWNERATRYFSAAQTYADDELAAQLAEVAHWFGGHRVLRFDRERGPMTTFPWIEVCVDRSAREAVETGFIESFKSPWKRSWTIGSRSVEGRDIQSAEMQASWAGAMWLLPEIQRQRAARLLAASRDPVDVGRGIGLWVRGGGKATNELADAFEGHLTAESISSLLIDTLHEGRSAPDRNAWMSLCHALWSEMPETVVAGLVSDYEGPDDGIDLYGSDASELLLFAKLLSRSELASSKARTFGPSQLALLARAVPTWLVGYIDPELRATALASALTVPQEQQGEWASAGWPTLARMWTLLPPGIQAELHAAFTRGVPEVDIPVVAELAPSLLAEATLWDVLEDRTAALRKDVSDARRGVITGRVHDPAVDLARLVRLLGRADSNATTALVEMASAGYAAPSQRQAALTSLLSLAREELLSSSEAVESFDRVPAVALMTDDVGVDQRYEDLIRVLIQLSVKYDSKLDGHLLAGTRDTNARVRDAAVSSVTWLSLRGSKSHALDAALLGALYDPNERVIASAIPAVASGAFANSTLRGAAEARMLELWPSAGLQLRVAIASGVTKVGARSDIQSGLRAMAELDRSSVVRAVAHGDSSLAE